MTDFGRRVGLGDMLKSTYDPNEDGVIAVAQTEADMKKSVYDEDEDGAVEDSAKLQGSSKAQVQDHTPQTHGHTMAFITGLITALAGKSATGHAHALADVTGLVAALAGKSATGHAHAQADVTDLVTDLAGKSDTGHTHTEVEITDLDHDAQKIKGVAVDDTDKGEGKVLAYNATSGNLEYETAGAGDSYVDRGDVSNWDWTKATLTEDHNWNDLACAGIVPVGTTAIMFRVRVKEDTTGRILELREKGNSNDINAAVITVDVANVQKDMCCVVACDANRKVQYRASSTVWTAIDILVKGWFV